MTFIDGQIVYLNALILKKHANIVSGAYKNRKVYHGTETDPDKQLTDEELLQDEMRAMGVQLKWLEDTVQLLPKEKENS